jgi:hypothetical protein
MKHSLRSVLPVLWLLTAAVCLGLLAGFKLTGPARWEKPDDNPDKFYLWTTNSVYGYAFTYDPHAVDVWLFRTVGPLNTNRP